MAVWDIRPEGKTDEEIAQEGLKAMESWMEELGVTMNLSALGVTEAMLEPVADHVLTMEGGYKPPTREEIIQILRDSL